MAVYHFDVKVFSRGKGHSVVQKAAYRSGQKLFDQSMGETHDFTRKRGVIQTEILAPEHAPEWMRDRERLWNAVEFREGRKDSQLAREVELAIPRELSPEARFEVVREFVRDHFVSQGMVADVCWHAPDSDKPHAHIMLTMRALDDADPCGFGEKVRAWNARANVLEWRGQWAEYANRALEREGHRERIDHRSYRDRGIPLEAQPKVGRPLSDADIAQDRRDRVTEGAEACARVARRNGERIAEVPEVLLTLLTSNQSTFTREQMLRALNTHTADVEQFNRCLAAVMASPELVPLHADVGPERFTTRDVLAAERRVRESGQALAADGAHKVADAFVAQAIAARPTMNPEQQQALAHLTRDTGALALLEGYAGTGKSFMLDAAREAWEAQGLTVVGGALAGKAAEGLEESSGIQSRTLASWLHGLDHGTLQLTAQHVLVIDESGMVGTRQMGRLLEAAQLAGAKVVLVGDSRQLEAIEAGSPFHMLATEHGAEKLTQVMRQRTEWMREATKAFGDGEPAKALAAYHANGKTHGADTHRDALKGAAEAWARHHLKRPGQSSLMLAYTRDDVHKLNAAARKFRVDRGELAPSGLVVQTEYGQREFSRGDRIYFGLNDKREIGVTNGSLGTVEAVRGSELLVKLDGGRLVVVDTDRYKHLDHGYAVTVHKSQGVTVDRVFAVADDHWRSASAYVAMSRHRDAVDVFWSRDQFRDQAALDKALCRASGKGMAHDLLEEAEAARVAELAPRARPTTPAPALSPAEARARRRAELVPLMEAARARSTTTQAVIDRMPEVVEARAREVAAEKEAIAANDALHKNLGASWLERLRGPSREDLEREREEAYKRLTALRAATVALVHSPEVHDRAADIARVQNEPLAKLVNELQELARADVAERDAGRAPERGKEQERDRDSGRGRGGRGWDW